MTYRVVLIESEEGFTVGYSWPRKWTRGMSNGKTHLIIPRHNPINAITMGHIAKTAG